MQTKVTIKTEVTNLSQYVVIIDVLAELARNGMDYHAKYEVRERKRLYGTPKIACPACTGSKS